MDIVSENGVSLAILFVSAGVLGWGYWRAKKLGKLGGLAWLQSVSLMAPWLIFFTFFAVGIYLNLVTILGLLIASSGLYIYLGNKLRSEVQDQEVRDKLTDLLKSSSEFNSSDKETNNSAEKLFKPVEVVPISGEELQKIKEIFGIDTFFATDTISYQEGAIFKGNLRGEPASVQSRLSSLLQQRLGDKYRLFLLLNPEDRPVVIVLPTKNDPQPATYQQKILSIILVLATIATSLETAGLLQGFDFFNQLNRWSEVLPLALGIWAILLVHELGHQWMAKRHQVRFSLPYFLPAWQLGSFGAFNRFESILPHRSALFDVAFAGPAAGGLLSLGMLITGFFLSNDHSLFEIPTEYFQGSFLVGTLAKIIWGEGLKQSLVHVHPLVVLGWLGLIVTAINLMPAGQLDGGRIVQAIYGRKIAGRTTVITLIVLAVVSFLNPISLYWALVILFLQRNLERPALNDLTDPNDTRATLGLLALFFMLITLVPFSPGLASRLGIGH